MVKDTNMSFKNSVKSKFSPQINKELTNSKGKNMIKLSYVSPLLSPIPAKLAKEVNKISKFFKKTPTTNNKKSYA